MMDHSNLNHVLNLALTEADKQKVFFHPDELHPGEGPNIVTNPYYGSDAGFRYAIELFDKNNTAFLANNSFSTLQ